MADGGKELLTKSAGLRLGDLLRAINDDLAKADDGRYSLETRVSLIEDNMRELVCALLGATNPVILESARKDGSSPLTPTPRTPNE